MVFISITYNSLKRGAKKSAAALFLDFLVLKSLCAARVILSRKLHGTLSAHQASGHSELLVGLSGLGLLLSEFLKSLGDISAIKCTCLQVLEAAISLAPSKCLRLSDCAVRLITLVADNNHGVRFGVCNV